MATRTRRNVTSTMEASASAIESPPEENGTDAANLRRVRKRELDRRCQRIARERTKNRISYLEGLVEDFREQDSTGQVATLMKQLSDMAKEREALVKTLQTIQHSIQSHQNLLDGSSVSSVSNSSNAPRSENLDRRRSAGEPPHSELIEKLEESDGEVEVLHASEQLSPETQASQPHPSHEDPYINTYPNCLIQDPIYPQADGDCECCGTPAASNYGSTINMWRFANEVLTQPAPVSKEVNEFEDAIADDTPVRAVLEGWDSVARRYGGKLPSSWEKLRKIDEVMFARCNNRERLAIMRVMHTLMRYHTDKTEERKAKVPAWYLQRPSQTMAHSYAIDYFAWPGLRERFVFFQHRFCGNVFWHLFCNSLRISWPYEFRDCYTRNLETGEYKISPGFDLRVNDINCWTMRPDISTRWPELSADFPRSLDQLPLQISVTYPPQPAKVSALRAIEAGPRHPSDASSHHTENDAGGMVHEVYEPDPEQTIPMAFWDSIGMDALYSQAPEKHLTELLAQGHYSQFNSGRTDFVF